MYEPIIVFKGRTNVKTIGLGFDISGDEFTSEIRTDAEQSSELIIEWGVSFETDGVNGRLVLKIDATDTLNIEHVNGFMDIKRISGGESFAVFDEPIPVVFKGTVTQ